MTSDKPPERVPRPSIPTWVKVFGACAIALLVIFIVLHLSGHGFGGHGMAGHHG